MAFTAGPSTPRARYGAATAPSAASLVAIATSTAIVVRRAEHVGHAFCHAHVDLADMLRAQLRTVRRVNDWSTQPRLARPLRRFSQEHNSGQEQSAAGSPHVRRASPARSRRVRSERCFELFFRVLAVVGAAWLAADLAIAVVSPSDPGTRANCSPSSAAWVA